MASRSLGKTLGIRVGTDMDAQMITVIRYGFPWLVWLLGLPVAALALRMARRFWGHSLVLTAGMLVGGALLTWLVWRISSARGKIAKWHPTLTMAGVMVWLVAMTNRPSGLLGVVYLVGGMVGCIAWNVRNSTHADPVMDVLPGDTDTSGGPRYVDMGALVRAIAGHAPVVRTALEAASPVVPALARPWQPLALEAGKPAAGGKVLTGTVLNINEDRGVDPKPVWRSIDHNWRRYTRDMPTGRELNGARLMPLSMSPSRIKAKVKLLAGRQTPKMVEQAREQLASLMRMPLSSIRTYPNPKNHAEVFVDFTIHDRLKGAIVWQGPEKGWRSIGEAEVEYGVQEDGQIATMFQPPDLKRGKNTSHTGVEGINGSGKSATVKIPIATGLFQPDVEDWGMDPIKGRQTLGCLSSALEWFAITRIESVNLMEFAVDIITERANYLGIYGYEGWEPGCGLPFLRLTLEEGNMVADMLGDALEATGNTARSAGVSLWGSFQRMHSDKVSTGLRAVFAESMSFGCKKPGDAFILSDEQSDAGADPSIWGNEWPGKHYYNKIGWPLERKIMETRSFMTEDPMLEELAREHAEAKRKKLRETFPDWFEMLARVDAAHDGVYSNRTTGQAVREEIDAARAKKAAKEQRAKNGPKTPTTAEPAEEPEPEDDVPTETEQDEEMTDDTTAGKDREHEEGMSREPADPKRLARELEKMGEDAAWLEGAGDTSADRREIWMPKPDEVLNFGQPRKDDNSGQARARALAHGISYLAGKPGWSFQPHDWAEACMDQADRSMSWYRQEMKTLKLMGLVEHDPEKGVYKVVREIKSERTAERVAKMLEEIKRS